MKGFGSRERNGLIVFCCIVILFLALGPIADRLGCTRRPMPPDPGALPAVDTAHMPDTARHDDYAGMRDSLKGNQAVSAGKREFTGRDTVSSGKGRKKASGRKRKKGPAPVSPSEPRRRNYLDEPV
ncbi:MAG: hypothetical protein K2F87_05485 [Muribaculaceae bacterium]|nr:hypothetical protein [Muribaculaceae bacterium]